jgi:hypothetical protein
MFHNPATNEVLSRARLISRRQEFGSPTYQSLLRSREFTVAETISVVHRIQHFLKLFDILDSERQRLDQALLDLDHTQNPLPDTASPSPTEDDKMES